MKPPLTWEALDGVVHVVLEADDGYPPPRALVLACAAETTWFPGRSGTFGHIMSAEIRAAGQRVPPTCLQCLAYCRKR